MVVKRQSPFSCGICVPVGKMDNKKANKYIKNINSNKSYIEKNCVVERPG